MDEPQEADLSALVPPAVMRSALGWTVPFAVVWAIGAAGIWSVALSTFGTTWPPFWHSPEVGLAVIAVGAVFGAICAVGVRLFLWLFGERQRRRHTPRHVHVKDAIKTAQDWQEL